MHSVNAATCVSNVQFNQRGLTMSKLSVLIPVFNEKDTILKLIEKVEASHINIEKEILIADDCSTDGTRVMLEGLCGKEGMEIHFMDRNVGRGAIIKYLWQKVTCDIIIHQDADLEYDPDEYQSLLDPIIDDRADVVYGSRFKGNIKKMKKMNNLGNRVMTLMTNILYSSNLTDLMTCYKMYRTKLIEGLNIKSNGFNFEAEFTARLVQRGARFEERPISFVGRSFEEGKKIRMIHAFHVTQKLLSCKFTK